MRWRGKPVTALGDVQPIPLQCYNTGMATFEDWQKLDIRIGKIVKVEVAEGLKKPAYEMTIDFGGEIGQKISIGQYTQNYTSEELEGKLVACVVNFLPLKMGPKTSEVLTLGFPDTNHNAVLISPSKVVPLGGKLY